MSCWPIPAAGHNIVATVFVQARAMYRAAGPVEMRPVGETEFVNGVAAMSASGIYGKTRVCAGIVGHADLTLGSRVEPVLAAHIRAGGDRFRGIRHITAWDADESVRNPAYSPPPNLLADQTFREGFAVLGRLGLSFDAWLYHPQIDELTELARAFPETRIVLNHVGGPIGIGAYAGKRKEVFAAWAASIKALAACPNVYVKLGGLGMRMGGFGFHEEAEPPSSETLAAAWRPYVETCIEAFGAVALHVREQLPRRQGLLQLSGVLERLQAAGEGRQVPARRPISSPARRRASTDSTSQVERSHVALEGIARQARAAQKPRSCLNIPTPKPLG